MTAGETVRRPIGVFDSGIGGLSVLRALRAELPGEDFVYFADTGHAPYGERDDAFVQARAAHITSQLRETRAIKALVVACNTATAAAIDSLRQAHPDLPFVGVEPALKPAVLHSRTGRIAVLATRATLASRRFAALHEGLRDRGSFVLQPCDGLAAAIEADDAARVRALCEQYLGDLTRFGTAPGQIDTLVLGCTHYPFAAAHFAALLGPQVRLVDTGEPVARQTRRVLGEAGALEAQGSGRVQWVSTGSLQELQAAAERWLPA